jgi:hypothetical protein
MYYGIVAIVFFASMAMMVREGIWSNTLTFFNIIFSGLVAFGFYAPLTIWVDEWLDGEYTYVLDFLMIWAVFVVAMIVSRLFTDRLSRTRLRLKHPLDPIGGPLVGAIAAFVMTGFVAATLHTAPLAKDTMGGKLAYSENEVDDASALTAPEMFWLRFVEQVGVADGFGTGGFDASAFEKIYVDHREKLQKAPGLRVDRS